MSHPKLIEVTSPHLAKEFIQANVLLNQNNLNYIRPLDKDVNDVFDQKKIKHFALVRLCAGY